MRQQSNRRGKKPSESPHFFDHITYKGGGTIMYTLQAALTVSVCEVFREIINVCRQKWVEKNLSKGSVLKKSILMVDENRWRVADKHIPPRMAFDVNQPGHISDEISFDYTETQNIRFPKNIRVCFLIRNHISTCLLYVHVFTLLTY